MITGTTQVGYLALNYYFVFIGDLREFVEPDFANEFEEELPSLIGSVTRLAEIFAPLTMTQCYSFVC